MTHSALFVLPAVPEGEPEAGESPAAKEPGAPVTFTPTRLSRACTRLVLGGYALSVKIETLSELVARKLQSRGMM